MYGIGGGFNEGEPPKAVQLHGNAGAKPQYKGTRGHMLMLPPPGYKFIPRTERVCGDMGCFECYDIYCERCESKDRRIIELEMRNNELVKHITLLQARVFPRGGGGAGVAAGASPKPGGTAPGSGNPEPFAYVQSPVLYDPSL